MIKKMITMMLIGMIAVSVIPNAAKAEEIEEETINTNEETGYLDIYLNQDDPEFDNLIDEYVDKHVEAGTGVYVFVQDIDNEKIYRFPLTSTNDYGIYQEMPYGNYKVIDEPNAESDTVFVRHDYVFAINEDYTDVSVECYLQSGARTTQVAVDDGKPDTVTADNVKEAAKEAAKEILKTDSEDTNAPAKKITVQNILSYIAIATVFGLFIYNKFIRKK